MRYFPSRVLVWNGAGPSDIMCVRDEACPGPSCNRSPGNPNLCFHFRRNSRRISFPSLRGSPTVNMVFPDEISSPSREGIRNDCRSDFVNCLRARSNRGLTALSPYRVLRALLSSRGPLFRGAGMLNGGPMKVLDMLFDDLLGFRGPPFFGNRCLQ